ncbi:MAG TPA: AAA family ATPase [Pirellulaceae bacterium]|nr:AAA family ATPase [Pirellulaceae bacterium]
MNQIRPAAQLAVWSMLADPSDGNDERLHSRETSRPMYESHFELSDRPFAAAPLVAGYVPTANIEHARQALVRCAQRAEGIGLVIGSAGTGKSLLCQILADHFRQRQFQVALLTSARLASRRSLLQNILFELGLPYRGMDDEELRLSLIDHLTPRGGSQGLVLIVDEAHTLPLKLLEEVRLISNFVQGGQMRVRLVLAGSPAMEERLANPKLESLTQRIAARCYLAPLNREETSDYVRAHLRRVGGQAETIAPDPVLRAIHQASDGIPRLINQVCDHALILAALDGQKVLTPRRIEQAWADLQQLPAPWHETPKSPLAEAPSGGIEFGQLDDGPAAATAQVEIPSGDPLGEHALAELNEIDQSIRGMEGECDPPAGTLPEDDAARDEPEDATHELFGGGFDEEEVIIDRFASLESRSLPPRSRVASVEGQAIGQALAERAELDEPAGEDEAVERPVVRVIEATDENDDHLADDAISGDYRAADDPVLPELTEPPQEFASLALRPAGDDDRDMIIVESDFSARHEPPTLNQRRRKYRQLLSTLRKG